jgi:hypothetical protein
VSEKEPRINKTIKSIRQEKTPNKRQKKKGGKGKVTKT